MAAGLVAVSTVLVALLSGTVGVLIGHRREHQAWLRQQRLEAYTGLLNSLDRFLEYRTPTADLNARSEEDLRIAIARVEALADTLIGDVNRAMLLGPDRIVGQLGDVAAATRQAKEHPDERGAAASARGEFVDAARRVLRTRR